MTSNSPSLPDPVLDIPVTAHHAPVLQLLWTMIIHLTNGRSAAMKISPFYSGKFHARIQEFSPEGSRSV